MLQNFRSVDHSEMKEVMQGLSNSEALDADGLPS